MENLPKIVSRTEWLAARKTLLAKEKESTRQRDALSAERRALPMVKIDQNYVFDGPSGPVSLLDLFGPHPQLIVYHFMFDPTWEEGCKGCSFLADNFDGSLAHLDARDTAFAAVSRAPLQKLEVFKRRMGWNFPWFSSARNRFNYDFQVTIDPAEGSLDYNYQSAESLLKSGKLYVEKGDLPGMSVFLRDGGNIYHTYSTYQRGLDAFLMTYNFLDVTPLGRHEERPMSWLRHHDKYADNLTRIAAGR